MSKHLDYLYRRYKRKRIQPRLDAYKNFRDILNEKISAEKINFYSNKLSTNNPPAVIWSELEHLGLTSSSTTSKPRFTPDEHNKFFLSTQNFDPSIQQNNISPALERPLFKFTNITIDNLNWAFKQFSTKSKGPDGISLEVLKLCLPALSKVFVSLFNKSIILKKFPSAWKHSHIIPVNKIPNPLSLSNYRPISLLSILSKIFEKIIHNQLSQYLTQHKVLDTFQSGFQKQHSTQALLTNLVDDICRGYHDDNITILLMLDLSKAFDRVSHKLLLSKLLNHGLSKDTVDWFSSYLSDRTQSVILGNKISSAESVKSGVPQGSVLGPLLFLIYMNDISSHILYAKRLLFADDLQIYLQIPKKDYNLGISLLQNDLKNIETWASHNNFQFNKEKTSFIIFGKNCQDFYSNKTTFYFSGSHIPISNSVKNLGIFLDSDMSWRTQINHISKSINYILYRLRYFKNFISPLLRRRLVCSLIFPLFDYGAFVMGNLLGYQYDRLQKLQNATVRYVSDMKFPNRTLPARLKLGWLNVRLRQKYMCALYIYNTLNNCLPRYLKDKINVYVPARDLRPHLRPHLSVPTSTCSMFKNSPLVHMINFWNTLPEYIRLSPSIDTFKLNIYRYLLQNDSSTSL